MRKRYFMLTVLCLSQIAGQGQGVTNKIKKQLPTSTYSITHFTHDIKGAPDVKNPQNKIIDRLENPPGTLVLDGTAEQRINKELIDDPGKIIFGENFVEIHYKINETAYRIPVTNISKHIDLNRPEVLEGLKKYNDLCFEKTKQVPESITLEHDDIINCCQFFSFSSMSNIYLRPYFQLPISRLNLGNVLIPLFESGKLVYYVYR